MTDATPTNLNAVANKDFAQIEGTINNFLNHKTTAAEAQQAFQQEYMAVNNDGVNNMIGQKLVDFSREKGAIPELPSLTIQQLNDSRIDISRKADDWTVQYDQKTGQFTAQDNDSATLAKRAAVDEKTSVSYIQPIANTAFGYFNGDLSAGDAQTQILQEVNDAAKAGYKVGDKNFDALLTASSQNSVHFTMLPDGELGISSFDSTGVQKRIEVDPVKQTAKAEDLHLTAKNIAASAGKFAGFGAVLGATTGTIAAPLGAAIGGAVGAGVGAIEGSIVVYELDQQLENHPGLIFSM
jgi:hypothetical protein